MTKKRIFKEVLHIKKEFKKKNVCAYARVSTYKNLQESSLELQIRTYTNMINSNPDWNFMGVYSDQGKSGTNTTHRPQFNLMIDLAKTGNIDLIITKSISRFARNTIDCLSVIQELKEYNTEVWFEKENISSMDPKIEFVISVLAGMAEEEARIISENVKWGVRNRFKQGKIHLVTSQVLGYDRDDENNIIINESEAKIVRKIYDLYLKGSSYIKIAEYLNKKGHKTKLKGIPYSSSSIRNILINEKYTGNALLQKSARKTIGNKNAMKQQNFLPKYYVKNTHPSIISQEKYDKVQDLRKQKGLKYNHTTNLRTLRNRKKNKSIYNGFIKCPYCGKNYQLRINHPHDNYRTRMLVCASNKIKKTCVGESLFADTFDKIMIRHINLIINKRSEFLRNLRTSLESHPVIIELKEKILVLEKEINSINSILSNSNNNDFSGTFNKELYNKKIDLQKNLILLNNKLLTTHNVDSKINKIERILKNYKTPIKSIQDFPFKDLFDKVIVKNRNLLQFIISFENQISNQKPITLESLKTEYLIRKTKFITFSEICIY